MVACSEGNVQALARAKGSIDLRVGGNYRLIRKIGSGSFGEIFLGVHVQTQEQVAVKLELEASRHAQLRIEYKIYGILNGQPGIPKVRYFGTQDDYNVMIMDLLGSSLEDLFCLCERRFSLKTVLLLADQLIQRVQTLHTKFLLHRDLKPDNFLIGLGPTANTVHVIDFGLSKRYMDVRSGMHIPYREHKNLTGTARYASINTHLGIEQSRRDDLESIGYILVYFLRGSLPWSGLKAQSKREKYLKIQQKKSSTPLEELCEGHPQEFITYLKYVRTLRFEAAPDYQYLLDMFRSLAANHGIEYDGQFDWTMRQSATPQQ
eukprot:c32274_g1_i1.p1 GENE.c32274_g1_i1~~c32274_g1_i1.p1  ORF type:complete len:319 (-),score=64.41 c32274_g1_i1:67-1023(-)